MRQKKMLMLHKRFSNYFETRELTCCCTRKFCVSAAFRESVYICKLQGEGGTRTVEGTDILAALGRTPNTQGIGLEKAGIEVTEVGHIQSK